MVLEHPDLIFTKELLQQYKFGEIKLPKYIDQEKRSGSQRISQIQREIARTKELKKSAHESSVRYQQFLCSLNSSASGCAQ